MEIYLNSSTRTWRDSAPIRITACQ
jgi:hypothetical protein